MMWQRQIEALIRQPAFNDIKNITIETNCTQAWKDNFDKFMHGLTAGGLHKGSGTCDLVNKSQVKHIRRVMGKGHKSRRGKAVFVNTKHTSVFLNLLCKMNRI